MPSADITVYRPNMRHELGFLETWAVMSRNVWRARELIWQLFKRDFFAAYKKSFMGKAWLFIAPLMGIVSWTFLQLSGVLTPGDVGIPYPAYVLVGTSMWGLFMGIYYAASGTLNAGKDLILQVNFPHEAMLFKQVAQTLAGFVITFAMNLVVLLCFKVLPSWGVLLLPAVALPLFFLGAAMGLMIAMIGVVAMDVSRFVDMAMAFMMYLTPVIYAAETPPRLVQVIIRWNPLTYLVCSCRDIMIYGRLYEPKGYFISAGISLFLFLVSWRLFYVSEDKLVERMV
jgi:lipopolysaccharide transport system permease protein